MLMLPTFLDASGIFDLFRIDGAKLANDNYRVASGLGLNLVYLRNQIVHGFMVSILCSSLIIFWQQDTKRHFLYWVGTTLCLVDIFFLIIGRMALISLLVNLFFLLYYANLSRTQKRLLASTAIVLILSIICLSSGIQMRLLSIYKEALGYLLNNDATTSGGIRLHYWSIATNLFTESPLLGSGAGSFRNYLLITNDPLVIQNHFHNHNEYLTILSQYGFIGIFLLLSLLRTAYLSAFKLPILQLRLCMISFLNIFLINSLTDSSLNNLWEGWSLVLFVSLLASENLRKFSLSSPSSC
jgi:O-antigen ligase